MSIFATLNTAVSGLRAAQRAMDVTGQNVTNANTAGYSRQRVELSSSGSTSSATFFTGNKTQYSGVTIDAVTRIRDAFLEARAAAAGARQAALTSQTQPLRAAQQLLSEPSDTGLRNSMDQFFKSWQDLAGASTDLGSAQVVLQRANAVTDQLHSIASGFAQEWTTTHDSLQNTLDQANRASGELAQLNGQIRAGTLAGSSVNDLVDKRDLLVRSLASLVGATATAGDDNTVSVSAGGVQLVAGTHAESMTMSGAIDISNAVGSPVTVSVGTAPVAFESGTAAGSMAALKTDLPAVLSNLDGVATAMRDAVNAVHATGYTSTGASSTPFFSGTGALTLQVVPTVPGDLAIAAAPNTTDGSVAARIGDLIDDSVAQSVLGGAPGPSSLWRQLTSGVATQVQSLTSAVSVQDSVVAATEDAVQSDAGVNLDEEMTKMLLYQRSYQASARLITTVDQMMATLMTTGEVGR
jgi:flagellar hook-associated protein 1 FlgK